MSDTPSEPTKPLLDRTQSVARPPVETLRFGDKPLSPYVAVFGELGSLVNEMRQSANWRALLMLAGALIVTLVVNMFGQVALNNWNGQFYSAIEKKNWDLIVEALKQYGLLVAVLLTAVVSQTWLHERLKIGVRECLSRRLLDHWLFPGRAYRLNISSDEAVNPDQRIQEDVRNFSEQSAELGVGLIQATLLLISFIGVLWGMSRNIHFQIQGQEVTIPGYMVWVALLYASVGSAITAWVGRPLISLNEVRYAREASFRFGIVRVSESAESVSFYNGERDERKILDDHLNTVLSAMRQVAYSLARLTWITSGYGWIVLVLPVVVALPGYLQGHLDLGGLMVVVGAFNQVQASLRWFVDNFAKIADWRAALHRVVIFRDAVCHVDDYENQNEKIELAPHPEGHLSFAETKVSLIDGEVLIANATASIAPGERVFLIGDSGSGKSTLFRAVAGLWPWGSGRILTPKRDEMMFLPQKPYMPLGTLAGALAYPATERSFSQEEMAAALERVHLQEFVPYLNDNERWDRLMSLGQQQRLAFARLLLHRPKWIFLDEATSALDEENQDRMMTMFTNELEGCTVMSIGHRMGLAEYHTRTLQLTSSPAGTILRHRLPTRSKLHLVQRFVRRLRSLRPRNTPT